MAIIWQGRHLFEFATKLKETESNPFPGALAQPGATIKSPDIEWFRSQDGAKLGCRVWRGSAGAPVVLYLHGIEGHGQWFEKTAATLNERGITIYASDRRGSGMNARERGHLSRDRVLLSDIESLLRRIKNEHLGCPVVLLGSCWAAKACAIVARRDYKSVDPGFSAQLAGLILICPAIYTKIDLPLLTKLYIAWQLLQSSEYLLQYWPLPLSPAMYTNEPEYLRFLEKDPLRLKEVTASFLIATLFLSWRAKRAAKFLSLPVLIVQSGADQIVDVAQIEGWYSQIASENKTMRIFPDAYHSIDFDQTWFKEYAHLLAEWLLARSWVPS
jgi:acylglycerol lipase